MSESLVAAMLGLVGVIFGALLQPLLTKWITPKSILLIKIRHNTFHIPVFLESAIKNYTRNIPEKNNLTEKSRDILHGIIRNSGYTEILIENLSSRAINSVSFTLDDGMDFIYDLHVSGQNVETKTSSVCEIGTLRANSTCTIRLWTFTDQGERFFYKKKDIIKVTAEEIQNVKIEHTMPRHITDNYKIIKKGRIYYIATYIFVIIIPILLISAMAEILKYYKSI